MMAPSSSHLLQFPWAAWGAESTHSIALSLTTPPTLFRLPGGKRLDDGDIRSLLSRPTGSPPIHEMARGAQRVCVAVDDLARPTPAALVLPAILDELQAGGVRPDDITIVVATGSHSAPPPALVALKVGPAVASAYRVEVHDADIGVRPSGLFYGPLALKLNARFLDADLRILVGSCLPHPFAGFSGGAKMVIPGLSDIEATARSHKIVAMGLQRDTDGVVTPFRRSIEALVGDLSGVFSVSVLTDARREIIGLTCGDLRLSHAAAASIARETYRTPVDGMYDCVLVNAYPKDIDLFQSESALTGVKNVSKRMLHPEAPIVLMTSAWMGRGDHAIFGPGGSSYRPPAPLRALEGRPLWIYAPGLQVEEIHTVFWNGYPAFTDPEELEASLLARLGPEARVGLFAAAPLQLPSAGQEARRDG